MNGFKIEETKISILGKEGREINKLFKPLIQNIKTAVCSADNVKLQ